MPKVSQSSIREESIIDTRRIFIVFSVIFAFLAVVSGRLWYLQVIQYKHFAVEAERNFKKSIYRPAPRGLIYDRNGTVILSNRSFFDLVIIPQYLQNKEQTIKTLSKLFHIPEETIYKRLQDVGRIPKFVPIRIKRNLSLHEVALIEANKFFLPGVDVEVVPRRDYHGKEMAHLFGYLSEISMKELETFRLQQDKSGKEFPYRYGSIIGKHGVEKKFEEYLRGIDGTEFLRIDARGRLHPVAEGPSAESFQGIPPKKGYDLYLTIDQDLQNVAQEAFYTKNGAVVAVHAQTGEILAYVSHPNFPLTIYQDGLSVQDWQTLQSNPYKPLLDKVTGGAYPPGSTYKIIPAIAALEEGVVSADRAFFCGGSYQLGNRVWRCWNRKGHGSVNLRKALEQSCDVYFYEVGRLLGIERIAKWARAFGLGEKTGLDLNAENPGLSPTESWKLETRKEAWQTGDTINVAIGQGFNLATPLQIVMAYAALGNGGHLMQPQILKEIRDDKGNSVIKFQPIERRFIKMKPENLQAVKDGLFQVVHAPGGTGKRAMVQGFTVAGKTGTAQTASLSKYKSDLDDMSFLAKEHAWFVAYSPADTPEIAVVVLSEYEGGGGGKNAAPIAQKIIEAYWRKKFPEKFPKPTVTTVSERKVPATTTSSDDVLPAQPSAQSNQDDSDEGLGGEVSD